MKVVILAGGFGTRLSEETGERPKPMVEIGGKPILWHIMSIYASHGFNDFVVACGYQAEVIKEYFYHFDIHNNDWSFDLSSGSRRSLGRHSPSWQVVTIDTGLHTMTGGRLKRLRQVLGEKPFMVTYGDGVGDVDIKALVEFHRSHGAPATVTAVRPTPRFGKLLLEEDRVTKFTEKPNLAEDWINGGFFVFEPGVLDVIEGDGSRLEGEPLELLARRNELRAYRHHGFWQPMDTLRDKKHLESLWTRGEAPWKNW